MAANKSLCPKMFEQWTIDRNTVGVKDSFRPFRQTGSVNFGFGLKLTIFDLSETV